MSILSVLRMFKRETIGKKENFQVELARYLLALLKRSGYLWCGVGILVKRARVDFKGFKFTVMIKIARKQEY